MVHAVLFITVLVYILMPESISNHRRVYFQEMDAFRLQLAIQIEDLHKTM
jgi:hypothetical protein